MHLIFGFLLLLCIPCSQLYLKKSGDQKHERLSFDIITSDYAGKAYDLAAGEIGMHTSFSWLSSWFGDDLAGF